MIKNTGNLPLTTKAGFTLIEISIVLVIIGLIVGAVIVGQDLIKAAATRAQISQIEKYNTAVNTFESKYGYLPGDIADPYAGRFGFTARGTLPGQGDANGLIQGSQSSLLNGMDQNGETTVFWVDLSKAGLIDGSFSNDTINSPVSTDVTGSTLGNYFPQSKLGAGLYVYIYNSYNQYWAVNGGTQHPYYSTYNFFVVSQITSVNYSSRGYAVSNPGISVMQAYNIDKKIDDGLPISGRVTTASAGINGFGSYWFSNYDVEIENNSIYPGGLAIPPSSSTCYDNNNSASNSVTYSLSQNGGSGLNCSLSFKFQ